MRISSYIKLKENEKIIDAFVYKEENKILVGSKNGYGFLISAVDLYSNQRSGKKFFNLKKNDEITSACNVNEKNKKYVAIFINSDLIEKLLIFNLKEIPTLKKGSGVILFKSKNSYLNSIYALNEKFTFEDYSKNIEVLSKNMNSYVSKRGKSGKLIKRKIRNKFFRGFEENYIF